LRKSLFLYPTPFPFLLPCFGGQPQGKRYLVTSPPREKDKEQEKDKDKELVRFS
jgi:hypothetical protein